MTRRRITLISGIYPPDKGGPAQFISQFSDWLSKRVDFVNIVSLTDTESIFRLDGNKSISLISRKQNLVIRMAKSITNIVKPLFSKRNVLANGMFLEALIASFAPGTKLISKVPGDIVWERARNQNLTNLDIDAYQGHESWKMRIFRFLFTLCLKRSDKVIAPSNHLASLITRWGVSSKKIVVVRNSTDTELFAPSKEQTHQYDIISVGRLVRWKGFEELIRISSELKQSLVIVGDGPERENLELLAAKLGADVTFLGDISHQTLPQLLRDSGVFVLNSHYEGSPHSLIEALAAGCISVARHSTGSSEVLDSGIHGLLFKDGEELKFILMQIKEDPKKFEYMRKRARNLALEKYNRDTNFQSILTFLLEVR